jgi:hypothetical protein
VLVTATCSAADVERTFSRVHLIVTIVTLAGLQKPPTGYRSPQRGAFEPAARGEAGGDGPNEAVTFVPETPPRAGRAGSSWPVNGVHPFTDSAERRYFR